MKEGGTLRPVLPTARHPYTQRPTRLRRFRDTTERAGTGLDPGWKGLYIDSEGPPVAVINNVDRCGFPRPFTYSNEIIRAKVVPGPVTDTLVGCDCAGGCTDESCACIQKHGTHAAPYDESGRLKVDTVNQIHECNSKCKCTAKECRNRVVQYGRTVTVDVIKTRETGFGVYAKDPIPRGQYLGTYAGILQTWNDASDAIESDSIDYQRGRYTLALDFPYLFKSRNWKPMFVIDAFYHGNFTSLLNHSCSPNAIIVPCHIDDALEDTPHVTFFASRDIRAGEQITFNYSGSGAGHSVGYVRDNVCRCGSRGCKGRIYITRKNKRKRRYHRG
ncbi:hypothetical protein NMY22_g12009 [Coprinellus aureogranulatus]|nr:hypothetical protein NMY22_g12009 [Coprinellus aureogranulatus]